MRSSTRLSVAAATLFVGLASVASQAAALLPGQVANAVAALGPSAGATQVGTVSNPFATSNYTGHLVSTAYKNDANNPLGGVTFVYQLFNDVPSANALQRLTVNGFTGYATDFSYQFGTGDIRPTYNDRDATGGVAGFTFQGTPIGFGVLGAGLSSEKLIVRTNAPTFDTRIANVSNGAVSPVNVLGPAGNTPEPTTVTALVAGALLLRRRR